MNHIPIATKQEVKIGDWLAEAWQLTVDNLGPHLLLGLLVTVIMIGANTICIGGILVGMPIACGSFLYAKKRMLSGSPEIGDIFKGFDVFVEALLATLIYIGISILLAMILTVVYVGTLAIGVACPPLALLLVPLMILFSICLAGAIYALIILTPALLMDRRLKAWDAVKLSCEFGVKNFWMMSLFGLILILITSIGSMITMGIGCIFTTPFMIFAGTAIYRDWIGFEDGPALRQTELPDVDETGGPEAE